MNPNTPALIRPTVGRVVLFYPDPRTSESNFIRPNPDEPCAAIITRVFWGDRMVNLAVFDANGVPHSRTSVNLVQPMDPRPIDGGSYCTWMDYQVGQAARAEKAEAETQSALERRRSIAEIEQIEAHAALMRAQAGEAKRPPVPPVSATAAEHVHGALADRARHCGAEPNNAGPDGSPIC